MSKWITFAPGANAETLPQGNDCGKLRRVNELEQLVAGVGVEDAAARVDDRPLRHGDRVRSFPHLPRMDRSWRFPSGQVDLVGVNEVELGLLDVLGDVDEHRALAARARDVKRSLEDTRELLDVLDEPRVLDDRHRDARGVDLLKCVGADQR
jgi:hypothetical protein